MQVYKYCGQLKTPVKSHIIPRSFYEIKASQQSTPHNSLSMLSDAKELQPIILKPNGKLFLMKFSLKDANAYDILKGMVRIHYEIE